MVDGRNQRRVTHIDADEVNPVVSPDGTRILFVHATIGVHHLYLMDMDGSNQVRLTKGPADD
jgi:TolB protein